MITAASNPPSAVVSTDCAYPWQSDSGDGNYRNPILHADYSDPDVVRVGDDFYLTASSFNCTPGLPILHSRDLVNWKLINHALKNLPHARYAEVQPGCGVWAPAIRHHAGKFWIFFPTPDEGIYVTTATDPAGQWSEPHLLQAGKGLIDPCPLWDDEGKAYLVHAYAGSRAGIKHRLRVCPMAPDGSQLLGEGQIVFHEPEKHPTLEGPKFLKRDGWYYILAPAGGVATGWQLALRAKNIFGPYEEKIVLAQGSSPVNGPHQGALVDTPNGESWFLHFQDLGLYGRVVHLQPVHWQDGWPLMGIKCEPVLRHRKPALPAGQIESPATSDEFTSSRLGLQWQWNANHTADWHSLTAKSGWLRLFAANKMPGELAQLPNLLTQKFPARSFSVETVLELHALNEGDEAGLAIIGRESAGVGIVRNGAAHEVVLRINGHQKSLLKLTASSARLRVSVTEEGKCGFAASQNGQEFAVSPEIFQAQPGVWIGARVGLYSTRAGDAISHADFNYFRFADLSLEVSPAPALNFAAQKV